MAGLSIAFHNLCPFYLYIKFSILTIAANLYSKTVYTRSTNSLFADFLCYSCICPACVKHCFMVLCNRNIKGHFSNF